jgi:hypothetical protein
MMKPRTTIAAVSLALTAVFASPAFAADTAKPDPDQILRQMSAKLRHARQFSFVAHRESDASLNPGSNAPGNARIFIEVQRPNKIAAKSSGQGDVRHFYFDGQNLSMVDVTKHLYATAPMRTSIDGLVTELQRKYGFTPPLVELALSDIYADVRWKVKSLSYSGQETHPEGFLGLNGVPCHRLALIGNKMDAELWVGAGDSLPRKLIVTVKSRPGKPQIKLEFSDWNLAAQEAPQDFVFTPSTGELKVPMRTTEEMTVAQKKR